MSYLSREPDGVGFYYGFAPGDHRQINVRQVCPPHDRAKPWWTAYVGGQQVEGPAPFRSLAEAEAAAIAWAKENPEID